METFFNKIRKMSYSLYCKILTPCSNICKSQKLPQRGQPSKHLSSQREESS